MAPSRVVGGLTNSSSSSGIFFQGEETIANSHLSPSFGNSTNSIQGSLVPVSGDMSNAVFNSVGNSGPSVGASSLVTDANSALSGGARLQRSASINTDSYIRLPASPLSFSSNNISLSGSSIMDGSSSATSSQMGQCVMGSFIQDPNHLSNNIQKKPRLDLKQEDIVNHQVIQQLLQRQESSVQQQISCPNPNPQIQAYFQQQRLRQAQQIQQAHLQQQQQLLLRHQLQQQQQGIPSTPLMKRPSDAGICSRRLMQYLYHQRQRPSDNAIAYWRKFVAEYYSPRAKRRWCLSMYDNVGQHALGVFPQAAMDAWQCDLCNSKPGKGFEAAYEVLPRLYEIKFSSGVIDELLFVDLPREIRFPSGLMLLEYSNAVQESVYEQLRVIREGRLRITFTPDLKILCWEFCARRHEELLPRRVVAPQVGLLVQAAQKCQSTMIESASVEACQQELQSNSHMVLGACHKLAKNLELQSINELGFSKRYVRCLQISEVVSSMKELIGFCHDHKVGPVEGLKNYPRHGNTAAKLQMQKLNEMGAHDQSTLSKLMALHPSLNNRTVHNPPMIAQNSMNPKSSNGCQQRHPQNQQMMIQHLLQEMNDGVPRSSQTLNSSAMPALNMKSQEFRNNNVQAVDDFVGDVAHEFADNGFFDGELDENVGFNWKG